MCINTKRTVWESVAQMERKLLKNDTEGGNAGLIFALVLVKIACSARGTRTANRMTRRHYKGEQSSSLPFPGCDQSSVQIRYFQTSRVGQTTI